jgi:hypothetical protein
MMGVGVTLILNSAARRHINFIVELQARHYSNIASDFIASAISLPASFFRLLPLPAWRGLDVSVSCHLIKGAERLTIESDVFVIDGEACGPVTVRLVRGICRRRR